MTTSTKKTQDKQHVLQEARKASEPMERVVIQNQDEPNYLEIVAANIKRKGIKRITLQIEQI